MSGYFQTLLVASVCGAVCMMLAWGGFEKYIKYIASLVCVVLIISPFRNFDLSSVDLTDIEESSGTPDSSLPDLYARAEQMTEQRSEKYISDLVFSKFGIKAVYTDIKIEWSENEAVIVGIEIAVKSDDMPQAEAIKDYLFSVLGGEVTVVEEG